MIDAEKSDLFDVLAYIAFALPPVTREERVNSRRADIFAHYDEKLRAFLDFVLAQYIKQGVDELGQEKLPKLLELKYHSTFLPDPPKCHDPLLFASSKRRKAGCAQVSLHVKDYGNHSKQLRFECARNCAL
jgi:hypothetical protein